MQKPKEGADAPAIYLRHTPFQVLPLEPLKRFLDRSSLSETLGSLLWGTHPIHPSNLLLPGYHSSSPPAASRAQKILTCTPFVIGCINDQHWRNSSPRSEFLPFSEISKSDVSQKQVVGTSGFSQQLGRRGCLRGGVGRVRTLNPTPSDLKI